jgi:hypothetical protein
MSCKARISQESGAHSHRPSMPLAQRPKVVDMSLTSTKPPCWPDDEERPPAVLASESQGLNISSRISARPAPHSFPPPPFPPVPGPSEFVSLLPDHGYHCTVAEPPPCRWSAAIGRCHGTGAIVNKARCCWADFVQASAARPFAIQPPHLPPSFNLFGAAGARSTP